MQELIRRVVGALAGLLRPAPLDFAGRIARTMQMRHCAIDKGPGQINIVYVEGCDPDGTPNGNRPNAFDDARIVFSYVDGKPTILGAWEATTQVGSYFDIHPLPDARLDGAAIIELGQQACWTVGVHGPGGPYEALVQLGGPVTIARDKNRDMKRDNDKRTTGFYGINQHHGANAPRDNVGRQSAGCLVGREIAGHRRFMALCKSDPRYRADPKFIFRTTVLPVEWLQPTIAVGEVL